MRYEGVAEWFRRQAMSGPEAVAVSAGGAEVTYGELEASSNQLAELLQEAGCGRGAQQ